jgi:hypothetical protein
VGVTTLPFVVASTEDARRLLASTRVSWLGTGRRIVLASPVLAVGDRQRLERRLNFWSLACGCHSGAALALIAIGWCAVRFSSASDPVAITLLNDLALVIAAALVGKLAGLAIARTMFVVDLTRLVRRLADERPEAA